MRVSEFDAFGPWVYEVDGDHPLPPLFAPYVERPEQYRMLLKIPREIERRKATPDMDLYDYVIGADEAGVHIWSRRDKQVQAVEIPYGDIAGVRLYQRLLQGFLTIYGPAGESVMPYNTVSAGLLRKFVRLLRGEFRTDPAWLPAELAGDPALRETDIDIWLFNQMGDLRKEGEDFALDAYQPIWSAPRLGRHLPWERAGEFAGTLYLHSPRELLLLRSGKASKKEKQKYSAELTCIPWEKLRGVSLAESREYDGLVTAEFRLPGTCLRTEVRADSQGALRFLQSLADHNFA